MLGGGGAARCGNGLLPDGGGIAPFPINGDGIGPEKPGDDIGGDIVIVVGGGPLPPWEIAPGPVSIMPPFMPTVGSNGPSWKPEAMPASNGPKGGWEGVNVPPFAKTLLPV